MRLLMFHNGGTRLLGVAREGAPDEIIATIAPAFGAAPRQFAFRNKRKMQLDWISPLWYRQEPPISCTMPPPIELRSFIYPSW